MSERKLLLVAGEPVDERSLRQAVRRHVGDADARVRVVTPVPKLSPLEWLTNDEDDARARAGEVAERAAEAVGDVVPAEPEVGDTDPVRAVEDALRVFEADEILIVTAAEDEAGPVEPRGVAAEMRRFGIPVTPLLVKG